MKKIVRICFVGTVFLLASPVLLLVYWMFSESTEDIKNDILDAISLIRDGL